MTTDYSDTQQAEGKIQVAINRLAADYPFHVKVLEQFKTMVRPEVNTMGVTVAGSDILLLHNPAFVLEISARELGGVLLHEVHHVVLEHVLADPEDYEDDWARVVAEEVTVNEFVKEPLPGEPIVLANFPDLPRLESTRRRYDRLKKIKRRQPISSPSPFGLPQPGDGGGQKSPPESSDLSRPTAQAKKGKGDPHKGPSDSKAPGPHEGLQTLDDHRVWQEARKDPDRARAAIRNVLQQAALAVGLEQIPAEFQSATEGLGIGHEPREAQQEIEGEVDNKLDWRRLLRQYVGRVVQLRPVFNRPPRRFPELVGIMPGRRRQSTRPIIMAVLDTSGSITPELLEQINAELAGLAKDYEVTVVECDTIIHRVYRYKPLKDVCGRGGTDLCPPLEQKFLRKHHPDLIVYFTDGYGPAPDKPPGPPLVWCLVPGGEPPVAWGQIIRMDAAEIQAPGTKNA